MKTNLPPLQKSGISVYEWNAWNGFMFPAICPHANRIPSKIRQSNQSILDALPADTNYFLFQVNLTDSNPFFAAKEVLLETLKERNIIPLNGLLSDISKSRLQETCSTIGINTTRAERNGNENDVLIVKTNLNFGGQPELKLNGNEMQALNIAPPSIQIDVNYPVLYRKQIPEAIWDNKELVIEKYISNQADIFFRVYKLLNRLVISEVIDHNLIKKMPEGIPRINTYCDATDMSLLPEPGIKHANLLKDILAFSDAIQLDYGALDVVRSDDGQHYIIDVNPTPYWGGSGQQIMLDFLAGLESFANHPGSL